MTKSKITTEGIIKDRPQALLLDAIERREECPEAFLFSPAEAKIIYNARECIIDVLEKYKDIPEEDYTEELQEQILNDYFASFKRRRIPLKKLQKYAERLNTALYWSAILEKINYKIPGLQAEEHYKITTSTPEQIPDRIITPADHPEFFTATDTAARRAALELPDMYLYISKPELNLLKAINKLFYADREINPPVSIFDDSSLFYQLPNSKIFNAFNDIGATARRPHKKRSLDEKGREISIFEFSDINGIDLYFNNLPQTENIWLSVGDPNTDKLIKQALLVVISNGENYFKIPIEDFMKFRGLSDRKTALEKASAVTDTSAGIQFRICEHDAIIPSKTVINFFQWIHFEPKPGRGGSFIEGVFTVPVYNSAKFLTDNGQQIIQTDKRIAKIPDKQRIAYNIANKMEDNTRKNAGKKNSHILSVKTLLDYCHSLPLYPEKAEDAGTENYLRFPSEAPQRIIEPFIKGLEFITVGTQNNSKWQILESYTFKHPKGDALTRAELSAALKDYKKFVNLNIEYKFNNEPDYSHLIECKAKQKEKAKKRKQ